MWSNYNLNMTFTANELATCLKLIFPDPTNVPVVTDETGTDYINLPFAFDTETSSFYENGEKRAIMYLWQLGLNGACVYGRDYYSLINSFVTISNYFSLGETTKLKLYVHNLSYEFQFIRGWINKYIQNVFCTENRKVVYATTTLGIDFYDSLILSGNKSLEYIGNHLTKYPVKKLVGFLDYSKIRHSKTPLTANELAYAINDVLVLNSYIQEKIESDGSIIDIPLTNTGYVRNYVRRKCFETPKKEKEYQRIMWQLKITDKSEYQQLRRAFQGGFTHSSPNYSVLDVLHNVASYDIKSSYPATIALDYFPMSSFKEIEITSDDDFAYYLSKYCCIFDVEFTDIYSDDNTDYPLSSSKCELSNDAVVSNGRVAFATSLSTTLTELDYDTISTFYSWSFIRVTNFRIAERGYLPKPIIEATLEFFYRKTTLDGVPGKAEEYMLSKNMLNAIYGMMVTAIIRPEIIYNGDWSLLPANVANQLAQYNTNTHRFLSYAWGVWVTAHARHNLFRAIFECGDDYIYADTDSCKFLHKEDHEKFFQDYNLEIKGKIINSALTNNIPISYYMPTSPSGSQKVIGVFEYEKTYQRFKTLGAKRYMYEIDDTMGLTNAGVNPKKALSWLLKEHDNNHDAVFAAYNNGLTIPAYATGKNTVTYIDKSVSGFVKDYLGNIAPYSEFSFIHMEPQSYSLNIMDTYIDFIKGVMGIDN